MKDIKVFQTLTESGLLSGDKDLKSMQKILDLLNVDDDVRKYIIIGMSKLEQ